MKQVKLGVIGLGNMGQAHIKYIMNGEVPNCIVTAAIDFSEDKIKELKEKYKNKIETFSNLDEFFSCDLFDGVIIATPHYSHSEIAIKAFEKGLHVLCEKPAGVYTKQVRLMNEAYEKTDVVFSMMYNQRANPLYAKAKQLIKDGELGSITRTNWIITDWYRTQTYFNSGGWRATWKGEGGGVLLNQDPHQLDLWQWICGMPKSIQAFCEYGKHHEIEVEDDVTAFVEYENGASGVFVTSTGEAPGTNRFEISGDRGKILIENNKLTFHRLVSSLKEHTKTSKSGFDAPECWICEIPINEENPEHKGITINFVNSILNGEKLIAPGIEGINGLTISNAMYLSSWTNKKITLPIDEDLFLKLLNEKIDNSTFIKKIEETSFDTTKTY